MSAGRPMVVYFVFFIFPLLLQKHVSLGENSPITDFLENASLRAYEDSMPYIVSVEKTVLRKSSRQNQCTGMFISCSWISTSCTCLWQMNKKDGLFTWPPAILFKLTGGVTNKSSRLAQIRFAIKILYHQQCDMNLKTMDVALMMANYPFSEVSFMEGTLIPFPVASHQVEFMESGLDTFIRQGLRCAVFGWPSVPGRKFDFLMELNVELVKDEQCGRIACSYAPELCKGTLDHQTARVNSKGLGFVCAKTVNSWPPCTGFEGAPLVCGTYVWATVTAVKPCDEITMNGTVLMTRLDVQFEFLKSTMSRICSSAILIILLMNYTVVKKFHEYV